MSTDQPTSQIAALQAGLRSPDERTRAESAQGLVRLGHKDAIAACVQTLNDAPDPLSSRHHASRHGTWRDGFARGNCAA